MSTDDNAFRRVDWPGADGWVPSDDDDEQGLPLRARGPGLSGADIELLTLAARALGAVRVEVVDGEQWVNLHFADRPTVYAWNSLLHSSDSFDLSAELELDIMYRVVGGKRVEVLAAGGPLIKAFYESDRSAAARRAVTRTAAEITVAKENKQA